MFESFNSYKKGDFVSINKPMVLDNLPLFELGYSMKKNDKMFPFISKSSFGEILRYNQKSKKYVVEQSFSYEKLEVLESEIIKKLNNTEINNQILKTEEKILNHISEEKLRIDAGNEGEKFNL